MTRCRHRASSGIAAYSLSPTATIAPTRLPWTSSARAIVWGLPFQTPCSNGGNASHHKGSSSRRTSQIAATTPPSSHSHVETSSGSTLVGA